jgi:hypothetical protein
MIVGRLIVPAGALAGVQGLTPTQPARVSKAPVVSPKLGATNEVP